MPNMGNGAEMFLPIGRHDGPKGPDAARHPRSNSASRDERGILLSHGPCPCVSATSHSINALFFAADFGNDRAQERKAAPVPAPAGPQGSVLECFNATI